MTYAKGHKKAPIFDTVGTRIDCASKLDAQSRYESQMIVSVWGDQKLQEASSSQTVKLLLKFADDNGHQNKFERNMLIMVVITVDFRRNPHTEYPTTQW